MEGNKHYIRIDSAGLIIYGFSDAFETPQDTDILILEDGPRHFSQVWPEPLTNERGQFRYKWVNGERVERTQSELDTEYANRPAPPPSDDDRITSIESAILSIMGL